jgi:transcription elongation GreA/GreB family factor
MLNFNLSIALAELAKSRAELLKSWEEANKSSIEMDGRMQSRYDTQKEEYAGRANMIMGQIQRLGRLSEFLQTKVGSNRKDNIDVGNLVQIQFDEERNPMYLILLENLGGGTVCGFDLISINSPIGKSILGRKKGEKVTYNVGSQLVGLRIIDFI